MRWIKYLFILGLLIFGVFYLFSSSMEKNATFSASKNLNYSVEKLFPQFNNLQNFTKWNSFFKEHKNFHYDYFLPYEGKNSGLTFYNNKNQREGDLFIKYAVQNKALRYYLFTPKNSHPYILEVTFKKIAPAQTEINYLLKTPEIPVLERAFHAISSDDFDNNLSQSLANLSNLLSNKVDKASHLAKLKFDSVMLENQGNQILLGVNISAANHKEDLLKNIVLNHNKVQNFLLMDLQKEEDEFGSPVLITDPNDLKSKTISYYYGFPLSKKINVSDNNFIYKYISPKKYLIIYYKGNYRGRLVALQKLNAEAKKQELRTGQLYETFLEKPTETGDQTLKLALEIL